MPLMTLAYPLGRNAEETKPNFNDPLGWDAEMHSGAAPFAVKLVPSPRGDVALTIVALANPQNPLVKHTFALLRPGQPVQPHIGRRLEYLGEVNAPQPIGYCMIFKDLPWPGGVALTDKTPLLPLSGKQA